MTSTLTDRYVEDLSSELGVTRQLRFPFLSRLPTGLRSLDTALAGGVPKGHITEILGATDTAKSTLALHLLAESGGVLIDVDGHYDPMYARALGANPLRSTTVEFPAVNEVIKEFLKAGELVVVDSLASIVGFDEEAAPRSYIEPEISDWRYLASRHQGTLVLTDQLRFRGSGVGTRMRSTAGPIVSQNCAMRLSLSPSTYSGIKINVDRDFHHPSPRDIYLDLEEGYGFSKAGAWLDAALARGEIRKSGSWYSWPNGKVIAQGRADTKEAIRDCI